MFIWIRRKALFPTLQLPLTITDTLLIIFAQSTLKLKILVLNMPNQSKIHILLKLSILAETVSL
jgi:hypothetical protein